MDQLSFAEEGLHLNGSQVFLLTSSLEQDPAHGGLHAQCYLSLLLLVVVGLILASRCSKAIQGAQSCSGRKSVMDISVQVSGAEFPLPVT
jgi:hypothetical protein